MDNLTEAAKTGGKRMTSFGVIAITLGVLAMLAPGLTGVSIAMLLGGLVVVSGNVLDVFYEQCSSNHGAGL